MNKAQITVLKTTFDKEISSEHAKPGLGPRSRFREGQVFIGGVKKPEGFCDTA